MTDTERCPHTYQGQPCEQPAGHDGRCWSVSANWPAELSDQTVEGLAS